MINIIKGTFTYDKEADAAYITIDRENNKIITETYPITDYLILDLSDTNEVVGIEILWPLKGSRDLKIIKELCKEKGFSI